MSLKPYFEQASNKDFENLQTAGRSSLIQWGIDIWRDHRISVFCIFIWQSFSEPDRKFSFKTAKNEIKIP